MRDERTRERRKGLDRRNGRVGEMNRGIEEHFGEKVGLRETGGYQGESGRNTRVRSGGNQGNLVKEICI